MSIPYLVQYQAKYDKEENGSFKISMSEKQSEILIDAIASESAVIVSADDGYEYQLDGEYLDVEINTLH